MQHEEMVCDRPLGAIIATAGLGALFVVAAFRQRRTPRETAGGAPESRHATYDDLTSSATPASAAALEADEEDEIVFTEDASGARARSRRRPARWPWMLGAVGVGAVTALAVQRLSRLEIEPIRHEVDAADTIIPAR